MRHILATLTLALAAAALAVAIVQPDWFLRLRYPLEYRHTIEAHAENYDLPASLVAAVTYRESGFDASARSQAGAVGLMQLTPETARGIAIRTGGARFEQSDLDDPEINVRYGCWYLRNLHRSFGERGDGYVATLAAYNAGQGRVREWLREDDDGQLQLEEIPFDETRSYVRGVVKAREAYEQAWDLS